jgi:hypothetical protein
VAKVLPGTDWHTTPDPDALLNVVWPRRLAYDMATALHGLSPAFVRRLRLFGVACARMVWDVLSTDAQSAVLLSERHADGGATEADLRAATVRMVYGPVTFQQQATNAAGWASAGGWGQGGATPARPAWNPSEAAREAAKSLATRAAGPAPPGGSPVSRGWQEAWNRPFSAAREHQAELIRDVFPPPGYTPALRPEWRTSTAVLLARQAYETGEFSALPILADALQDAGCDDEVVLTRCRAPAGIHCRGNWVVDLVLERE